jgi:hypothetical protein
MDATQNATGTRPTGGVTFDHATLGQIAYHLRWSAALAAEGAGDPAPHAILANSLLEALAGDDLRRAVGALDLPDVRVAPSPSTATSARLDAATQLGLQLVAHFTSEGRHDLADLYQVATGQLAARR